MTGGFGRQRRTVATASVESLSKKHFTSILCPKQTSRMLKSSEFLPRPLGHTDASLSELAAFIRAVNLVKRLSKMFTFTLGADNVSA